MDKSLDELVRAGRARHASGKGSGMRQQGWGGGGESWERRDRRDSQGARDTVHMRDGWDNRCAQGSRDGDYRNGGVWDRLGGSIQNASRRASWDGAGRTRSATDGAASYDNRGMDSRGSYSDTRASAAHNFQEGDLRKRLRDDRHAPDLDRQPQRRKSEGEGHGNRAQDGKGVMLDDEGYLWFDEASGVCTYYQDRRRKWPFHTDSAGKEHLEALVRANATLRALNVELLLAAGEPGQIAAEGERLYVEKPTLRGNQNVTWSFDEYGHPGLQLHYLKLKSWQRFTETYALLERASRVGLFDSAAPDGRPLRVVALGGGPGYELLATRRFLEAKPCALAGLELINTDVQPTWRGYSEALGFQFHVFDIFSGGLFEAIGVSDIDYVIISYVMIYIAKTPGDPRHEAVCDELKRLLQRGVRAIIVSERSETTPACRMMESRGVRVVRLIDQSMGVDERQSLFLADAAAQTVGSEPADTHRKLTFPNVPFEEHKIKRGGAAGAGGSQTKWYS
uniref:Methyltransferase domain-containing protein n=1 Tax=Chrysotila carterae TaxID=13221 RepID=A0A7S4FA41_CHRCT